MVDNMDCDITDLIRSRKFLYPGEIKRGITLDWKPNHIVIIDGHNWTEACRWCKENINGLWMDHIYQPEYAVGFEDEEDAMAFKLRWTK